MTLIQSVILGIIQGITEFLPISSSGHLIIVPKFFNWVDQGLAYDTVIHLATALAIILALRHDIWSVFYKTKASEGQSVLVAQDRLSIKLILIAIIPAGLVGLFFNQAIEQNFRSIEVVAMSLIVWGLFLWGAEYYIQRLKTRVDSLKELKIKHSLVVGLLQVIALLPGTSRSGITITGGLFSGMSRKVAVKFSFLVGLPLILAAGLFKLVELINEGILGVQIQVLAVGFISALLSGLLAIKLLMWLAERANFNIFVIYRIVLGLVLLLFFV